MMGSDHVSWQLLKLQQQHCLRYQRRVHRSAFGKHFEDACFSKWIFNAGLPYTCGNIWARLDIMKRKPPTKNDRAPQYETASCAE